MYGKDLVSALDEVAARRGHSGFTFDDLARAGARHRGHVSDLAEWLARARSTGFVEDLGFDEEVGLGVRGPRRYRIAERETAPAAEPAASARARAG